MQKSSGFTLLELIMALAVFTVVMALSQGATVQGVQFQRAHEINSNVQNRVRRITEVLSQDIRTSALGMVIASPYGSTSTSISYAQLSGGADYPVTAVSGTKFRIVSATSPTEINNNDYLVLIDKRQSGVAVVSRVASTGAPTLISTNTYEITTTCTNLASSGFTLSPDTAMFLVNLQGYSFDSTNRKLVYMQKGDAAATDVAYSIDDFRADYIYTSSVNNTITGTDLRNPSGYMSSGQVLDSFSTTSGSTTTVYILNRIQITITSSETAGGRTVRNTNNAHIDLINNNYYQPGTVNECGI